MSAHIPEDSPYRLILITLAPLSISYSISFTSSNPAVAIILQFQQTPATPILLFGFAAITPVVNVQCSQFGEHGYGGPQGINGSLSLFLKSHPIKSSVNPLLSSSMLFISPESKTYLF